MHEITKHLAQVRGRYFETLDRLASEHPTWQLESDVRLTTFYKIGGVLNCTLLGLAHLVHNLLEDAWWKRATDKVPAGNLQRQYAFEFDQFVKIGCIQGVFCCLESSLREIVRTLDSTACNGGTSPFKNIYSWLFKRIDIQMEEPLLDLLRNVRNTIHNNGVYLSPSGTDCSVLHGSTRYEFRHREPVDFVNWEFLVSRFDDLGRLCERIVRSDDVLSPAVIAEPAAPIEPPLESLLAQLLSDSDVEG